MSRIFTSIRPTEYLNEQNYFYLFIYFILVILMKMTDRQTDSLSLGFDLFKAETKNEFYECGQLQNIYIYIYIYIRLNIQQPYMQH